MCTNSSLKVRTLAVCGKGGVGKTSISAMITKILAEDKDAKVLAIDADPAIGLATALGFSVTKTVDNIRNDLIDEIKKGKSGDKKELIEKLDYQVFEALAERENIAFLAIGRPEQEGCYCQVNSILKDIIDSITRSFDYVVIDGEAGIEQVNRRVLEHVSHLCLVSDGSVKGLQVAYTIKQVAEKTVAYEETALFINRIRGDEDIVRIRVPENIEVAAWIPEDEEIRIADIEGRDVFSINDNAALNTVKKGLETFRNLQKVQEDQCACS